MDIKYRLKANTCDVMSHLRKSTFKVTAQFEKPSNTKMLASSCFILRKKMYVLAALMDKEGCC